MHWCIQHHQITLQTAQELTDALLQVWEEIPTTESHYELQWYDSGK